MTRLLGVSDISLGRFTSANADLLQQVKANVAHDFVLPSDYASTNSQLKTLVGWLHSRGIKFFMGEFGTWKWYDSTQPGYYDGIWNDKKAEVILNLATSEHPLGAQVEWIRDMGAIISDLQPDIVDPMMESPDYIANCPTYKTYCNETQFINYWKTFIRNAVAAWRPLRTGIQFTCNCMPWYSLSTYSTTVPTEITDLLIPMDMYYTYNNNYSETDSSLWRQEYWNNNPTQARIDMFADLDRMGMSTVPNAFFSAVGACNLDNYATQMMKDIYEYCTLHNLGVLHDCFAYAPNTTGILNSDWSSLNAMGLVWRDAMLAGGVAPPPSGNNVTFSKGYTGGAVTLSLTKTA